MGNARWANSPKNVPGIVFSLLLFLCISAAADPKTGRTDNSDGDSETVSISGIITLINCETLDDNQHHAIVDHSELPLTPSSSRRCLLLLCLSVFAILPKMQNATQ